MNSYSYKEMLTRAKEKGVTSEKAMWQNIDAIESLLCMVKKTDESAYYGFLRSTYASLYSNHYATKEFAQWEIEQMHSKGLDGEYWSCEQAYEAVKSMGVSIPSDVTKFDLWVAMNAAKHDWGAKFEDAKVLEIGWMFYFADEDYKGSDKIFKYMSMVNKAKG
jgi:hypothetical protein